MTKSKSYFLAGVLCVIALYCGLWMLGFLIESAFGGFGTGASDTTIKGEVTSPDGEYVATEYVKMGGGAAGWCDVKVGVRRRHEPFEAKKAVFSTRCGAEVDLRWGGERGLRISYEKDAGSDSLYRRSRNEDGNVSILYEER